MPVVLIDISILLNTLGFGQALFLCISLLKKRNLRPENTYLIILLLAISLIILNSIFRLSYYVQALDFYQDYSNAMLLLIAPSVYLFVKSKRKHPDGSGSWWHYLPFLTFFVFLLIHHVFVGPNSELKEVVTIAFYLLFNLLFVGYFGLSLKQLHGKEVSSGPLKWIRVAVWIIVVPWIIQVMLLIVEQGFNTPVPDIISLNLALFFGVCAIFLSYMHQSMNSGFTQKEKYETSQLDEQALNNNLEKIRSAILKQQLYADPNFSQQVLAEATQMTTRVVSLTINQGTGQNFVDFINGYRVEAFKEKIAKEAAKQFTMVAIAEQCGFKSSSSFYAAFKKHTGMTPKQFKDTLK